MFAPHTNLRHRASDFRKSVESAACRFLGIFGRDVISRDESIGMIRSEDPDFKIGEISVLEHAAKYEILKWGLVRVDGRKCLDLDYGARAAIAGWRGALTKVDKAAALWSHPWMGYYHWIIDVAPKIALLQEKFGRDILGWRLCYPRQYLNYEEETLSILGVTDSMVIDTRGYRSVNADKIALSALPGWYEIQPAAALLRARMIGHATMGIGERIYISRKGRRKCANEAAVFSLLRARGFLFVEDMPRSLAEQIGIFQSAKVIVAPHGAALTNLLWCEEGTTVIELFGTSYQPPYYRNLSAFCSLDYHSIGTDLPDEGHWSDVNLDIYVDIDTLQSLLDKHNIY